MADPWLSLGEQYDLIADEYRLRYGVALDEALRQMLAAGEAPQDVADSIADKVRSVEYEALSGDQGYMAGLDQSDIWAAVKDMAEAIQSEGAQEKTGDNESGQDYIPTSDVATRPEPSRERDRADPYDLTRFQTEAELVQAAVTPQERPWIAQPPGSPQWDQLLELWQGQVLPAFSVDESLLKEWMGAGIVQLDKNQNLQLTDYGRSYVEQLQGEEQEWRAEREEQRFHSRQQKEFIDLADSSTDPELLRFLATDTIDERLLGAVIHNTHTPDDVVESLARRHEDYLRAALFFSRSLPPDLLVAAARAMPRSLLNWIERRAEKGIPPSVIPPSVWHGLIEVGDARVHYDVARFTDYPDVLENLAGSYDMGVRKRVASNPHTPSETLRKFITNKESEDVKLASIENPNTPIDLVIQIARDPYLLNFVYAGVQKAKEVLKKRDPKQFRELFPEEPHFDPESWTEKAAPVSPQIQELVGRILSTFEQKDQPFTSRLLQELAQGPVSKERVLKFLKQVNAYNPEIEKTLVKDQYGPNDLGEWLEERKALLEQAARYQKRGIKPFPHKVQLTTSTRGSPLPGRFDIDLRFEEPLPAPVEVLDAQNPHRSGVIAWAELKAQKVGEKLVWVVGEMQSDIAQRSANFPSAYRSKIENAYRDWHRRLFNLIIDLAKQNGVAEVWVATSGTLMARWRQYSGEKTPQLFQRVYDQQAEEYGAVDRQVVPVEQGISGMREFHVVPIANVPAEKLAWRKRAHGPTYWLQHALTFVRTYVREMEQRSGPGKWAQDALDEWYATQVPEDFKHNFSVLRAIIAGLQNYFDVEMPREAAEIEAAMRAEKHERLEGHPLEEQLEEAVAAEDYERAERIQNDLARLKRIMGARKKKAVEFSFAVAHFVNAPDTGLTTFSVPDFFVQTEQIPTDEVAQALLELGYPFSSGTGQQEIPIRIDDLYHAIVAWRKDVNWLVPYLYPKEINSPEGLQALHDMVVSGEDPFADYEKTAAAGERWVTRYPPARDPAERARWRGLSEEEYDRRLRKQQPFPTKKDIKKRVPGWPGPAQQDEQGNLILYHVTSQRDLDEILSSGLVPPGLELGEPEEPITLEDEPYSIPRGERAAQRVYLSTNPNVSLRHWLWRWHERGRAPATRSDAPSYRFKWWMPFQIRDMYERGLEPVLLEVRILADDPRLKGGGTAGVYTYAGPISPGRIRIFESPEPQEPVSEVEEPKPSELGESAISAPPGEHLPRREDLEAEREKLAKEMEMVGPERKREIVDFIVLIDNLLSQSEGAKAARGFLLLAASRHARAQTKELFAMERFAQQPQFKPGDRVKLRGHLGTVTEGPKVQELGGTPPRTGIVVQWDEGYESWENVSDPDLVRFSPYMETGDGMALESNSMHQSALGAQASDEGYFDDREVERIVRHETEGLEENEELAMFQRMVDNGTAWRMQGAYGRQATDLIRRGLIALGPTGHRDYWGNYVPSRYEVKPGTKGSIDFVRQHGGRIPLEDREGGQQKESDLKDWLAPSALGPGFATAPAKQSSANPISLSNERERRIGELRRQVSGLNLTASQQVVLAGIEQDIMSYRPEFLDTVGHIFRQPWDPGSSWKVVESDGKARLVRVETPVLERPLGQHRYRVGQRVTVHSTFMPEDAIVRECTGERNYVVQSELTHKMFPVGEGELYDADEDARLFP